MHGPVRLDADVEALVLDPCYRGTPVEAAAARLACPVEWHGGFRLTVAELRRHPGYRGPEFVDLGAELAVDGYLDPAIIGAAARTGRYDPQSLKRVWHCLARFGPPPATTADPPPAITPGARPDRPTGPPPAEPEHTVGELGQRSRLLPATAALCAGRCRAAHRFARSDGDPGWLRA